MQALNSQRREEHNVRIKMILEVSWVYRDLDRRLLGVKLGVRFCT